MIGRNLPELVKAHPVLAGLPDDLIDEICGCAVNLAFKPGALLLTEGEPADALYLVRRGRVAIEVHTPDRGTLVIETAGPGDAVGWNWLVPPYAWQFDARAAEPVGVVAFDGSCLRDKAEADPALGYTLLQRVAGLLLQRLQETQLRLLDLYVAPRAS